MRGTRRYIVWLQLLWWWICSPEDRSWKPGQTHAIRMPWSARRPSPCPAAMKLPGSHQRPFCFQHYLGRISGLWAKALQVWQMFQEWSLPHCLPSGKGSKVPVSVCENDAWEPWCPNGGVCELFHRTLPFLILMFFLIQKNPQQTKTYLAFSQSLFHDYNVQMTMCSHS